VNNPTAEIALNFPGYCETRGGSGMGPAAYSFSLDESLRKRLDRVPGLYRLCRAYCAGEIPRQKRMAQMNSTRVSPSQFGEIYQMTLDCARTLGIGVPDVYLLSDAALVNAWTYAFDDEAPVVFITSALVERFTRDELKFTIGHECGHIHCRHGVYSTAASILEMAGTLGAGGLGAGLAALLSVSMRLALLSWIRAAEVTCDRAGMLCVGDAGPALTTLSKFMSGAIFGEGELSPEEAAGQLESVKETPVRLLELSYDHPIPARRILAAKAFAESEVFSRAHPERGAANPIDKERLDQLCAGYVRL